MSSDQSTDSRYVPTYCYNCVSGPDLLTVKVVDATTGAPVEQADVYPFTQVDGVGIVIAPQLTTKEGAMVIRYSVSGTEYIGIRITKPGYQDGHRMWRRGSLPGEVTHQLSPNR